MSLHNQAPAIKSPVPIGWCEPGEGQNTSVTWLEQVEDKLPSQT